MEAFGGLLMRMARLNWAVSVAAPWLVGVGLLVSFTADADQEMPSGASRRRPSLHAAVMPKQFERLEGAFIDGGPVAGRGLLREARLYSGATEDYPDPPDEIQPRAVLKKDARAFPEIDRSHKGDPFIGGLRPSFSGRLRRHNGLLHARADLLVFTSDRSGLASSFAPAEGAAPGPDSVAAFEPWDEGEKEAFAAATPDDDAPADALRDPRLFGAALSSPSLVKHNVLSQIAPDKLESERRCLAQAVYFEARGEPEQGQAAVAQVVINRLTSGLYPGSICGVVFQNRSHYKACQFSFACEGRSLRVRDAEAWTQARRVADDALAGRSWLADVGKATHYHAEDVRPRWARSLKQMDVIGKHIFYRLEPGQS